MSGVYTGVINGPMMRHVLGHVLRMVNSTWCSGYGV